MYHAKMYLFIYFNQCYIQYFSINHCIVLSFKEMSIHFFCQDIIRFPTFFFPTVQYLEVQASKMFRASLKESSSDQHNNKK